MSVTAWRCGEDVALRLRVTGRFESCANSERVCQEPESSEGESPGRGFTGLFASSRASTRRGASSLFGQSENEAVCDYEDEDAWTRGSVERVSSRRSSSVDRLVCRLRVPALAPWEALRSERRLERESRSSASVPEPVEDVCAQLGTCAAAAGASVRSRSVLRVRGRGFFWEFNVLGVRRVG